MKISCISIRFLAYFLWMLLFSIKVGVTVFAGQTGKIAGRVLDAQTGEALVGVSVVIEGTYMGAATDVEGYYYIANVPPGRYTVVFTMVGYQKTLVRNVDVRIDLTTTLDIRLRQSVVELGKEVLVEAQRPLVQKDLTSTAVTVSHEEIKMMPVEEIQQVINLQAGVIDGHFRGGRLGEVTYLIDGIPVTDPHSGQMSVEVEKNSIREMEVISGTFNAEYGQAMSGVVNIVTEEGGQSFHGSFSSYLGDYFTAHKDVFPNVGRLNSLGTRDAQFTLSGPSYLWRQLTFFLTGRYYYDRGYLFGKRVYNVTDDVPYFPNPNNRSVYINRNTGDGAYVPMNPYRRYSLNAKVTYRLPELKFSYSFFWDDNFNKYYDHSFAWTPDGIMSHFRTNWIHNLQVSYIPSQSTFYTFKVSVNRYNYQGYLYKDPYDPRYVDPYRGSPMSAYTFRSGGNQGGRYERQTLSNIFQWQVSSQLTKEHKVGAGVELRLHRIFDHDYEIVNMTPNQYDSTTGAPIFTLGYRELGTLGNLEYTHWPREFSAYIQDKMEYEMMIINAGIRFDYFDPNAKLLVDLRNPTRNPSFPHAGEMRGAKVKMQMSPRLGISFPITDEGIIHFSYGHFFQIPAFSSLYYNSDYIVLPGVSLSSITGNPDLDAERTVMYEIGLQQVLFTNIALDFTVYYRDIRNLLGMEIINTYEGFKYARFINRDYGNVKGFILTLDKRFSNYFSAKLDYTFQVAEGNASDPYAVYNNNQTEPPIESNKTVVPLDWDQRSTLNLAVTVGEPGSWTVGLVFQYGSGFPYTEDIRVSKGLRFENGGRKPSTYNMDLRAEKRFRLFGLEWSVFLLSYNLLDIKNEYGVNPASGRANVDPFTYLAGPIIGLNTLQQYLNDPSAYSAPRQVRVGFSVNF
ncbi:MAG: TonB-dependent receptor [Bacteroidota bacterium]